MSLSAAARAADGLFYPTSMLITPADGGDVSDVGAGAGAGAGVDVSTAPHVLFVKRRPLRPASAGAGAGADSGVDDGVGPAAGGCGRPPGMHTALRQGLRVRLVGSRTQQQAQRAVDEGAAECQMHLEALLTLAGPSGEGVGEGVGGGGGGGGGGPGVVGRGQEAVAQALLAGRGAPMAMDVCLQAIRDAALC